MTSYLRMPKFHWSVVLVAVLALVIASFGVPGYDPPAKAAPKAPAARHASAEAKALARARSTGKRVEVVQDRTARSTTFAEPTGRFTTTMTAAPTRVRQKDGSWAAIDEALAASNTGYAPKVSPVDVYVSDGGTGDVAQLQAGSGTSVGLTWPTALPAPSVDGATATYAVSDGTSLQATAQTSGFSARIVLDAPPASAPTYRFGLDLHGLTASLKDGVLRFSDGDGTVVAATRPLSMWDARIDAAGDPAHQVPVDAKIVAASGGGQELVLTPSMDYLTDPATKYPVTVDPDIIAPQNGDTYFFTNNTTPEFQDYRLMMGTSDAGATVYRSYANFKPDRFTGEDVLSATLDVYQYFAGSCDARTVNVYPPTTAVTNSTVVWGTQPSITTSSEWSASASFNRGLGGCPTGDGHEQIDVTKIVSGWATGELAAHGMELRAGSESDNTFEKRFCSMNPDSTRVDHCNDTSEEPNLSVSWAPQLGMQPWYSMTNHRLNDRSQLRINNDSGDAVIQGQDLRIKGVGMDLNVDRFYNGASSDVGAFGPGWTMSAGPDVKLKRLSADRYDYQAPSGTVFGTFVRDSSDTSNFHAPDTGGLDADLHDNGDGTMTMTFRRSQEKYTFSDLAGCSVDNLLQTKDVDRHGNEIDFHYDGSACGHLTSITDTAGRIITVDYANNRITQLTDANVSPTRTWQYGYTNGQLTSYTDPAGAVTTYDWTAGQVTTITDPPHADGVRPTTSLTYQDGQVTQVDYTRDASGGVFEYDWAYSASLSSRCNGKGDFSTDVTDQSDIPGGVTTYCFQNRADGTDRAVRAVDGLGNTRTSSYSPDQTASSSTDPVNDGVTDGATIYAYNPNQALTQVTEPTETSGDTAATAYFDYDNPTSVAGGSFLPTSRTTAQGHCTAYGYNAKGDLTDSYQGIIPSTGHDCSSQTSSAVAHTHTDYNDNGTPADAYTDSGNGTNAADQTVYSYYDSTAGGNQGQLKQVVRPGGDASCDSTGRKLCTSYTYDGDSHAATVTDGRGKTTRYSYDPDDRITQVLTDGATSCTLSAGTCTQYSYDGEGNLVTRADNMGTYTYSYDQLNQLATYTYPSGDQITTNYDGAGNLLTYTQHIATPSTDDTVTYTYNAANEATSVTDVTGTITLNPDKNGRLSQVTFPASTGIAESWDYTKSGKITSITISGGTGLASSTYSYKDGGTETDKLQTTSSGGATTSYGYDKLDRLTSADASAGTDYSYDYDGDGNLTTMTAGSTTTHYGYNEADELCWSGTATGTAMARACPATPAGNTTWTSDDAGNNTGTAAGPLVYNGANQAASLTPPSGGTTVFNGYTDQGNDLRVGASNDSFLTGPLDVTERTVGKTNQAVTFYTRDPYGHLLDQHGAAPTRYYLIDRENSITGMVTPTGTTAATFSYDPYGAATVTSGDPGNSPWQYINSYTDTEGDTYQHLGARYYHPTIGRFTQPDSVHGCISRPDTYNPYLYANDDPINNTDPSGRSPLACYVAAAAFLIAFGATAIGLVTSLGVFGELTIPGLILYIALVGVPFEGFLIDCSEARSGSEL